MENLKNLDQLNPRVRKIIVPYLNKLLTIHQDNIVAIFACGEIAQGEYMPKTSDVNLCIILEKLEFPELRKSLKVIATGIKQKIAPPLFLTRMHLQTSTDVFPVEFLEMKENHLLLYGEDLLNTLVIGPANIRLFCEEQIKGKLIRIRQAYLEVGLKRKGIAALLKESLAALTPIFRNLIRLKGETPPVQKAQIYTQLCAAFDLDKEIFLAIFRGTQNEEKIGRYNGEVLLERFIAQIQKLAMAIDQL